ncbi:MAG: hypothetical protein WCT29_01720 [Candidatus Paceibacterota bacterium]|jgi:hypothetical protein
MNFIKNNFGKLILILAFALLPVISFADTNTPITPPPTCNPAAGKICPPIAATSFPLLIKSVLVGALKVGIPVVALAIIYSGFLFVFARGKEEKLTEAKNALLYSVIGATILLGSWAIAEMISTTITTLGQ